MEPYDDVTCLLVGNDSTFRLLVGIASFASALIEFKYGRTVGRSVGRSKEDYRTLNPDIQTSRNNCTTVHVKLQCRIRVNCTTVHVKFQSRIRVNLYECCH